MKDIGDIREEARDRVRVGAYVDFKKEEIEFKTLLEEEIKKGEEEIIEMIRVWQVYAELQSRLPCSIRMLSEFFDTYEKITKIKKEIQSLMRVFEDVSRHANIR